MIVLKNKKFLFFTLFIALIVVSAMPSYAGSGRVYVAESGQIVNALSISEENTKQVSDTSATALTNLLSAATEEIKIETGTEPIKVEDFNTALESFTGTKLDISDASFTSDSNSDSSSNGVTMNIPDSVIKFSASGNTTLNNSTINFGPNMETFIANGCGLSNIGYNSFAAGSSVGLAATPALKEINISYNNLTSLGFNLSEFTNLTTLDISHNKFLYFDVPSTLSSLSLICDGQGLDANNNVVMGINVATSETLDMSRVLKATVSTADDTASVSNIKSVTATDATVVTPYDSSTGKVTFSNAPTRITYTYDTGAKDMDVTVNLADEEEATPASSSSGCNSAMAACGLLAVVSFLAKRKY